MKEGIELLRQIWSDKEVVHKGKYYTLEGYNIVPKPVQKPPPIWIAVSPEREQAGDKIVDQAMRRVGALGRWLYYHGSHGGRAWQTFKRYRANRE